MARWEAALEEKVRLARWWGSDMGARYAEGFAGDVSRKGRPGFEMYQMTARVEAKKLREADPVWVDDGVMDLLEFAADAPSYRYEPFYAEGLFAESGFALLPRARLVTDINGKRASFRALSWGPLLIQKQGEPGPAPHLHVVLYTHFDDDDDFPLEGDRAYWRSEFGSDLSMFHGTAIPWGMHPREVYEDGAVEQVAWDDEFQRFARVDSGEQGLAEVLSLWRFLQSFFRLAGQRILVRERTQGDRKSRRRMARIDPDNTGVLVVRLRRTKPAKDGPPGEVDWSQRWIVGGHWRNQHYPSLGPPDDPDSHRQIWIAPYVKGPDDKPLVLHSGKAYEFVR